jgi:1,4-alpha-glucan branching enzyme
VRGTAFAVWAPSARSVSVVGDFNSWDGRLHPMRSLGSSGIWELFLPGVYSGAFYKFEILTQQGEIRLKAEPVAFATELPPKTASMVYESHHEWDDAEWLERRRGAEHVNAPVSIYEVHLGSWRLKPGEGNRSLSYLELADELSAYARDMGFRAQRGAQLPARERPVLAARVPRRRHPRRRGGFHALPRLLARGWAAGANEYGGNEDLDAVSFLKEYNEVVHRREPGVISAAEESTAWPGVSRPTYLGGLGFGFKWNMGWMHDTLAYFQHEPIHRRWHHHELTFSLAYAFTENFILPLSHDEVVHGKRSMLSKMPGDRWQQLANLRALYAFTWAHPGKKLLFMGNEFAQEQEWSEERSLDWHLLENRAHSGIQSLVRDLNRAYRDTPALWERDDDHTAFWWLEPNDAENSVFAFACRG